MCQSDPVGVTALTPALSALQTATAGKLCAGYKDIMNE